MAEVGRWNLFLTTPSKGSSFHDMLFLCEKLCPEEHVYSARSCCSVGYIGFLPSSRAGTKILGVLSSATVPNSDLPEL